METVPKTEKKTRRTFVDARAIVLMRETDCERASALVAGNVDLDNLAQKVVKDVGQSAAPPPGPGPGAMRFGKNFENEMVKKNALALLGPLGKIFNQEFKQEDVKEFPRSGEGEDVPDHERAVVELRADGRRNVWIETAKRIRDRWTNNESGSIIVHGVLRIPEVERAWYLEPDLLVSPPGCPWYIPFEIKSYERNAFLENEHEIASAVVQSSIYLYCLLHGKDENDTPFPEAGKLREDRRTGLVFRRNGTRKPEVMLAAAGRDLHAVERILSDLPGDDESFEKRFGISREAVRKGDESSLDLLDHVRMTYSDACVLGCGLAPRCQAQLRQDGVLAAWGDALRNTYAGYETGGDVRAAFAAAGVERPEDVENPDLRRALDVESEIDGLLARAV